MPYWLFLLLVLLYLGPAFLPGKVLLPLDIVTQVWPPWQKPNQAVEVQNPLITDVVDYIYPIKAFTAEAVKQGQLPLWNPYILAGYPATYDTQAGLFYPMSLFYDLLPGPTAVNLTIFSQTLLGGWFMIAYLRLIGVRRWSALLGAIIFSFNGMMIVWLEWQVVQAAVIWLPLQLYFAEKMALAKQNGRSALPALVATAVAFALPWLGGHWNWTLYVSLTTTLYLAYRFWPLATGNLTQKCATYAYPLVALSLGTALCLIQVLPAFNYLRQGHRQALPIAELLSYGLHSRAIVALLPNYFGNPVAHNWNLPGNQTILNYNETALYMGLLPLLLSGFAVFGWRRRPTLFFGAWGGLGVLWVLGTPAYRLLASLPIFNGLLPSRAIVVVVVCVSMLAPLGLDALFEQTPRRAWTWLVWLVLPLCILPYWANQPTDALYFRTQLLRFGLFWLVGGLWGLGYGLNRLPRTMLTGLACLLVAADLWLFGHGYNPITDTANLYPMTSTTAFLQADASLFRMATLPEGIAYPPNTSLMARLANVSGYEPAILRRMVAFMQMAEGQDTLYFDRQLLPLKAIDSPLLDLLNVKYIVTSHDIWAGEATAAPPLSAPTSWLPLVSPLGWSVQLPDAGFHRLLVPIRIARLDEGVFTVRIFTADQQQELAHSDLPASDIANEEGSFSFSVFPSEWGRTFYATLEYNGTGSPQVQVLADNTPAATAYYFPRPQLRHEEGKTRVFENEGAFPRAFWVGQGLIADSPETALGLVGQYREALDKMAILELEGEEAPPTLGQDSSATGQVTITAYELNQVQLTAVAPQDGFLVLGDTYYSGWRAAVDGRSAPIYRADTILRAVYLPAGEHTITFSFLPLDFVLGAFISIFALLVCVGLLIYARRS